MENSYYKLKEISKDVGRTGTITIYQVVDYDGDEEKLNKMLDELNEKSMFYDRWYDDRTKYADGKKCIKLDYMHLD